MAEKECSSSGCTKESCEGCPSKKKESFLVERNLYSDIKQVTPCVGVWIETYHYTWMGK